ncbi:hypothetical protein ACU8KH_00470 [Lachancea thermotolerans]
MSLCSTSGWIQIVKVAERVSVVREVATCCGSTIISPTNFYSDAPQNIFLLEKAASSVAAIDCNAESVSRLDYKADS